MQRIPNFLSHLLSLAVVLGLVGLLQVALAQNSGAVPDTARPQDTTTGPLAPSIRPLVAAPEKAGRSETSSSALVLGPGDELEITVYGAPDLSGHSRVSADGNISIPLIGYDGIGGRGDG